MMMFMVPSDPTFSGNDPQMAKGRIDDGEDAQDASVREAAEELGLRASNIESIHRLGVYLGRTTVFIAKVKDKNDFGTTDEETLETMWLSIEQFNYVGRDLHRGVVLDAHRMICEIEGITDDEGDLDDDV